MNDLTTTTNDQPVVSLEKLTEEIKFELMQGDLCFRQGCLHYINAGFKLIQAKKQVPHGEWATWLKNNFELSQETARNYMNVAKRFGVNSKPVWNLEFIQMLELLRLSAGDEEKFIASKAAEGNPVEEMTKMKLREEIKKWKAEAEQAKQEAEKAKRSENDMEGRAVYAETLRDEAIEECEGAKKCLQESIARENGLITEIADLQDDKYQLEQKIDELKEKVRKKTVIPDDYEANKKALAEVKAESEELKKKLEERVTEVVTEYPKDYEETKKQLADLQAQNEQLKKEIEERPIETITKAPADYELMKAEIKRLENAQLVSKIRQFIYLAKDFAGSANYPELLYLMTDTASATCIQVAIENLKELTLVDDTQS